MFHQRGEDRIGFLLPESAGMSSEGLGGCAKPDVRVGGAAHSCRFAVLQRLGRVALGAGPDGARKQDY